MAAIGLVQLERYPEILGEKKKKSSACMMRGW